MAARKNKARSDLDVYRWRERFRRSAFTVLREEYASRVDVRGIIQQARNAARKYAPGKETVCRVTSDGDVVIRVRPRPKGSRYASRAA